MCGVLYIMVNASEVSARNKSAFFAINITWLVITLLVFFVLVKLGMWQANRAEEKSARIARINTLSEGRTFTLNDIDKIRQQSTDSDAINDLPVRIKGKFDKNIFLDSIIEKIVVADPKNAPYGEAAINYFKNKGIYSLIEHKLVYGESISQVNEHILNKTADIGITAKSIVKSPKLKGKGNFIDLGSKYWIEQGAVIIKNENDKKLKKDFLKYVSSSEGIKILEKYGYSI